MPQTDPHKRQLEVRLAAALRENLKRRKTQARGKAQERDMPGNDMPGNDMPGNDVRENDVQHSHDRVLAGNQTKPAPEIS